MVSERIKMNSNLGLFCNQYFWRTRQQQEIDYIEDSNGSLQAFEFKYSKTKPAYFSKTFTEQYHPTITVTINTENHHDFINKS